VYVASVIDALGQVLRGTGRVPTDGPMDLADVLAGMERTRADFACACRYVKPFLRSPAGAIRSAAEAFVTACEALPATGAALARALEAQYADDAGPGTPGAAAVERGWNEAVQRKVEAWVAFVVDAAGSIVVVVERREGSPRGACS
jgi:hypothetical protein